MTLCEAWQTGLLAHIYAHVVVLASCLRVDVQCKVFIPALTNLAAAESYVAAGCVTKSCHIDTASTALIAFASQPADTCP